MIAAADLKVGAMVWFYSPAESTRLVIVVSTSTRGLRKVDILWEKSAHNYAVARITPDRVQGMVAYPTTTKLKRATVKYCRRVRARDTGASKTARLAAKIAWREVERG